MKKENLSRRFEGEVNVSLTALIAEVRKEHPDFSEETIMKIARERRNLSEKHLREYLRGNQLFVYKKKPIVVKARTIKK